MVYERFGNESKSKILLYSFSTSAFSVECGERERF
jgi:hypothetical protein